MEELKRRILIVEDDKLAQKMAVMTLNSLNCIAHTASTGAEAIIQYKANTYDLIFMDLGLPDIDGYTVTEIIRELEKDNDRTPIIALTAHIEDEFKQDAKRSDMDDFISKPLTLVKAKEALEQYVNH